MYGFGCTVERRMASVEFEVAAHSGKFKEVDGKITELQHLVGVLRSEEPPPPVIADRVQFDRAPDPVILVARTWALTTMDAFKNPIKPILEQSTMSLEEVSFSGLPASQCIQVRVCGASHFAQRGVSQILGSLR
ncbi:unnamed protein product [Prorocentrum cordatum]|uniref:Uncharacterized protein n=1 Tax=Prorocentrum cordatum TaxID=2364126 RepID=A0ABN9YAG5_9DINO|nr:unnamed protein product [Polarella glacialis]